MRALITLGCILLPLLTGCSSEPNEQELSRAYQKSLDETNAITDKISSHPMHINLQEFKKTSCKKTTVKQQYLCKIDVVLDTPLLGIQKQQGEIIATKQGDNWVISYE